ncbi:MAG: S8 family serine peptidase [Deltaproteobacteria bacterium]|nr:S8 family serine peptidase [Deltaproteobacteria bacterium]
MSSVRMAPDMPWSPERTRTVVRGRLLIKVRSGYAPEKMPNVLSVRSGVATAPLSLGNDRIDGVIKRYSQVMRVSAAFRSARSTAFGRPDGVDEWDSVEEEIGLSRMFRVDLDPDVSLLRLMDALAGLHAVESVSPYYLSVTPFEHNATVRAEDVSNWYGWNMVKAREALAAEQGDSALIVGIVDTGVDIQHPELQTKLRPGLLDCVDLPRDQLSRTMILVGDAHDPDTVALDETGHGTACASIIGAVGIRVRPGLAGAARILSVRALASARFADHTTLTGVGAAPDLDIGLKATVDLGARVINLSFGTPDSALREEDPLPHLEAVEYAKRRGCILVAASGNSARTQKYYPACLDGVIAVGSVDQSYHPSRFTTRGRHVDLCAPGEDVPSAGIGGYAVNTGTSFAAPFVTGACALLVAKASRHSRSLDAETACAFLKSGARKFSDDIDATGCGAGVLDANQALQQLDAAIKQTPDPRAALPIPTTAVGEVHRASF